MQKYLVDLSFLLCNTHITVKSGAIICTDNDRWDTNRHSNAEYEMHLILQGSCTMSINDKTCRVSAGQGILISPGQYHMPTVAPGAFERFSLPFSIHSGVLACLIAQRVSDYLLFELDAETEDTCRRIFAEMREERPFHDEMVTSLHTQVVAEVFRTIGLTEKSRSELDIPSLDWRTSMIDSFFEENFAEYGAEDLLAEQLHLSKRQLARVLNEKYGMSFRVKLLSTRMDHAGWLLRTTDKKVSEISSLVGYSSEGSFFKTFNEYYKVTPQRYRSAFRSSLPR